ncbi:hypothetical protein KIN34_09445 [Cellulomonas sp. DKR-3]|uniref:Lipocalin-like domain-containing protein n=1 Tax=Cellulomonas fulva TaxID=2835530 RepID=A0ABS5TZC4_9CELL|nr:hypothetical protein [Cellulomonas fulva]MBT0994510.1 hypothetical protein [Cellulomonas fulva]
MDSSGVIARSGQTCTVTGVWQVVSRPSATARVPAGAVMPADHGHAVTWRLVRRS